MKMSEFEALLNDAAGYTPALAFGRRCGSGVLELHLEKNAREDAQESSRDIMVLTWVNYLDYSAAPRLKIHKESQHFDFSNGPRAKGTVSARFSDLLVPNRPQQQKMAKILNEKYAHMLVRD